MSAVSSNHINRKACVELIRNTPGVDQSLMDAVSDQFWATETHQGDRIIAQLMIVLKMISYKRDEIIKLFLMIQFCKFLIHNIPDLACSVL